MKTIIVGILLFLSSICFAQEQRYVMCKLLTNAMADEMDGYIDITNETYNSTEFFMWRIGIPDFYDFDLVRASTKAVVNSYSDLFMYDPWTPTDYGYGCILRMGEKEYSTNDIYFYIIYYIESNTVLVSTLINPK